MTRLVPLNNEAHRELKIASENIDAIGANERMVPVVVSEFLKLSVQYPIVLTKNADTGLFVPVVLTGFKEDENLFWTGKRWDALYVPLNIRRQPFFIGHSDQPEGGYTICVDMESNCVSLENGERIFDSNGKDTEYYAKAKIQLANLLEGELQTQDFIKTLAGMNLFTALGLEISFVNDEKEKLHSLYTIDEKILDALSNEDITQLHEKKYLKPLFIMMSSLSHIYTLVERKNKRLIN